MSIIKYKSDVLVAGGGVSGIAAAIQAARSGANVILVCENDWFGGMLTAAGVGCVDGNHDLPSGLYGEFREELYRYYGRHDALDTGWVSHTCFEPRVGNNILHAMIANESNITVMKNYLLDDVILEGDTVRGAHFRNSRNELLRVEAQISIDASELGDLIAASGASFRSGRESRDIFNESAAPVKGDAFIQDLTYVAILQEGSPVLVEKPETYNPEAFRNCCKEFSDPEMTQHLVDAETMLEYGRLPGNKFMINWPKKGNDFYLNLIPLNETQRLSALEEAKKHTLSFVYFIQRELGFSNLGLAEDQFPTKDRLPLIPYHRESRRVMGKQTLTLNDLVHPYRQESNLKYRYGVAVGDYPLDHHHDCLDLEEVEEFPPIPAFNVPYGSLIPAEKQGLIAAEKCISVSHVVNGCTRLQPVVMQIGQAAGSAAAHCLREGLNPAEINVRIIQKELLDASCWLMPFSDISPSDPWFGACQRIGLCGIMEGEPVSKGWANKLLFHPADRVSTRQFKKIIKKISVDYHPEGITAGEQLTLHAVCTLLLNLSEGSPAKDLTLFTENVHFNDYLSRLPEGLRSPLTRSALAMVIDIAFMPFEKELKLPV